ncbi:MAG: glycosyltransferase [Pseudomonadota bacterium]
MRVALSISEFPSASQTFVLDHAAGMIERGHVVSLHALALGQVPVAHASIARLGLMQRLRTAPPPLPARPAAKLRALLHPAWRALLRHPGLAAQFLRDRSGHRLERLRLCLSLWDELECCDIVHAHSGYNGLRLLPLYDSGHLSAPLLVTFHGHDVHAFLHGRPLDFYAPLFARAAALVVCSDFMRERLLALGAPVEKLHLIPNGIDLAQIPFRARNVQRSATLQLLTIGRLVPFKGLQYLLAALALPALRDVDLTLHIVGDGPLKAALLAQAEATGLSPKVIFHGACPREKVLALMAECDLYIAPAIVDAEGNTETQGVALIEAMASGLPVIASAVGGIPETLGDAAVALVAPATPAALATSIAAWASNLASAAAQSLHGRQRVEQLYSASHWIESLLALYDSVHKSGAR